jgi:cytochrome d ubiquinol oxidase subunit II
VAQYPALLSPGLTIAGAAASRPVLTATAVCLGIGALLLIPSLTWLYVLFQQTPPEPVTARRTVGGRGDDG